MSDHEETLKKFKSEFKPVLDHLGTEPSRMGKAYALRLLMPLAFFLPVLILGATFWTLLLTIGIYLWSSRKIEDANFREFAAIYTVRYFNLDAKEKNNG